MIKVTSCSENSVWLGSSKYISSFKLSTSCIDKYWQVLTSSNNSQLLLKLEILDKFRLATNQQYKDKGKLQHFLVCSSKREMGVSMTLNHCMSLQRRSLLCVHKRFHLVMLSFCVPSRLSETLPLSQSYRSLSHLMLWNWCVTFVYLFSGVIQGFLKQGWAFTAKSFSNVSLITLVWAVSKLWCHNYICW